MSPEELRNLTWQLVADARRLSAAHTDQPRAPVNYACIFAQTPEEYQALIEAAGQLGAVASETATGPVFEIEPLDTEAGELRLLKVRRPDPKRTERGDADFTVSDYASFKRTHLGKPGFGIIQRPEMEMIELIDPAFNVLAYYSHPTLAQVLRLDAGDRGKTRDP